MMNLHPSLKDIASVFVHWSESNLINDELGCNDEFDINKEVDPVVFDNLLRRSAQLVGAGYDKTVLTIKLKDGSVWANECKFYLNEKRPDLISLIGD